MLNSRTIEIRPPRPRNVRRLSQADHDGRLRGQPGHLGSLGLSGIADSAVMGMQRLGGVASRTWHALYVRAASRRVLLLALVVASATGLGWGVHRYATTASAFHIQTIELSGAHRLTSDDVSRISGLRRGVNVFEVSPRLARTRLEQSSWIASARVRRELPATVHVEIMEHVPAAVLMLDRPYWLSDQGIVFKALNASDDPTSVNRVPQVQVVDVERFKKDERFRQAVLLRAVGLLRDVNAQGLDASFGQWSLRVDQDESLVLQMHSDGSVLYLGTGPYLSKLRRVAQLRSYMKRRGLQVEYVRMDGIRNPSRVALKVRP
jgi:cell division protein FtsQ